MLDPSQGDKHYPGEKIYWVNKNKVRNSFEAAAIVGVGGYLTGSISEIMGAAAINEASMSTVGGSSTSIVEFMTSQN